MMTPATMTAARLHGVGDLRIERLPVPVPEPEQLLVKVEACGICPTDARKWEIGVDHGSYPLNPGHEWVGRVVRSGDGDETMIGRRVYGDTYGGYAQYATIGIAAHGWSSGALPLAEDLALQEAVFIEPLADCLHAVHDQAQIETGDVLVVIGAGSMGLQLIAAGVSAGARVIAVEPRPERRQLATRFGAELTLNSESWVQVARDHADGAVDAVIVSIANVDLVAPSVTCVRDGGRVVLFAGFGDRPNATLDLNEIHYREVAITGSEWIGVPPNVHLERYGQARELLLARSAPVDLMITGRCGFDGLEAALRDVRNQEQMKVILIPEEGL